MVQQSAPKVEENRADPCRADGPFSGPQISALDSVLDACRLESSLQLPAVIQKALFLARRLQQRATELQTPPEKRQQAELDRMLQTPSDKATLAQMTDQAFRSSDPHRAVEHLIHILDVQGVPRCFSPWDRALMRGFQSFGGFLPGVALPLVKEQMHKETANVILPGERELLTWHLAARTREGLRMNVNFLGEAILSEAEAERRLQQYLQSLQWPEIEVVSIKISTLYSQLSPLAREHTIAVLCDRLERLFLTAHRARFTRYDGEEAPKFVYLDMEEYRDKDLTAEAFMKALDRPALKEVRAGIALQSYIPDSFQTLIGLAQWARGRASCGGGRITIRLVKGANLEMERAEASIRGWPQAPYKTKLETDANYKRMLHELFKPENVAALNIGVASHNLFDLAYGLALAHERQALDKAQFEMLEGMANHQRRALFELCPNVLLYAPACKRENFINAIGYLIRRLDENTGPENFLRHAFKLQVGSPEWKKLEEGFLASFSSVATVSDAPRRTQNRLAPLPPITSPVARGWQSFENEPDTDFTLPQNGEWARQIIAKWQPRCGDNAAEIPLVIAGEDIVRPVGPVGPVGPNHHSCLDPSRPGVVVGRYPRATESDIARAIECAAADPDGWRAMPVPARFELLCNVAQELRHSRADLLGAALANGGKTFPESDPEVSEAVDFVEFYRDTARWWQELPTLDARPKGVVVVISPWNFPISIPCGGVAAALAAGNTVILKPSSDTVLVAWELCKCFWRAGVSKKALQFLPCSGAKEGRSLTLTNLGKVGDKVYDGGTAQSGLRTPQLCSAVILTGGTDTALAMLRANPRLPLFGETGGKDATIVTALSDRDQAIKHIIHSAFSHAGQKCSATSLVLLQDEVYDDASFRRTFCEAAQSLVVGSAWNLETKMGPLIRPPGGVLETALKVLEPGEEWALMPQPAEGNPNLWTPGIKYGVRPGSFTHTTEFFGPVLAVMRFEALSEAVALVDQTGFGLTSGLESLDEREWDYWRTHINAGNLYINRVTTGAVVLRQPFGGFGKSSFGPGMKAGGPNYVAQFMEFQDASRHATAGENREQRTEDGGQRTEDREQRTEQSKHQTPAFAALRRGEPNTKHQSAASRFAAVTALCSALRSRSHPDAVCLTQACASYEHWYQEEFGSEHDHFKLVGQDNFRRYLPAQTVRVRVHARDTLFEIFARACAAHIVGSRAIISHPPGSAGGSSPVALLEALTESWAGAIEFIEESDRQLCQAVGERQSDRLRYAAPDRVPVEVLQAGAEAGACVISAAVSAEGRLELLWYLREQSISIDYHRYGNLGPRAVEPRAPVL